MTGAHSPNALAWLAVWSMAIAVALVTTLHVLVDDDPVISRLSEYATGPYGYLMVVAFVALGVGIGALGLVIVRAGRGGVDTAIGLALCGAGLAMAVSGLFPTDPGETTVSELIHRYASGLATILVVGASIVWSFAPTRGVSVLSRVLAVSGVVLVVASVVLHDSSISGLSQRVLWAVLIAWLGVAALDLVTSPVDGSQPGSGTRR